MAVSSTKIVSILMWRRVVGNSMVLNWIMFCFRICTRIVFYNFMCSWVVLFMMNHWIMFMVSNGIMLYGLFVKRRWRFMIGKCIWRRERF